MRGVDFSAQPPLAHHQDAIGEGQHLREIARHEQAGRAAGRHLAHDAVDVELRGELTRGMTIADRRSTSQWKRNTDVLTKVDVRGVLDWMERLLSK